MIGHRFKSPSTCYQYYLYFDWSIDLQKACDFYHVSWLFKFFLCFKSVRKYLLYPFSCDRYSAVCLVDLNLFIHVVDINLISFLSSAQQTCEVWFLICMNVRDFVIVMIVWFLFCKKKIYLKNILISILLCLSWLSINWDHIPSSQQWPTFIPLLWLHDIRS